MKKLSLEKVMLDIPKEDVALKKYFLAEMKNSDKEQCDQLQALNETMLNLTKLFGQPTPPAIMQNRQFVPPYPTHSMIEQTSHAPSMIDQTTHVHGRNVGVIHPINAMNHHGNTYNFH